MKKIIKLFLICTTLLLTTISNAQDQKSFTIENVSKEVVWPAVFSAFKELKLPRPLIATQQGTGETRYYNYTSLMIKNRLRFKINYQAESLTISIFGRQYYTKSGWADNPLPMSKKRAAKILKPIKERVIELTKNKIIAGIANKTPTNQETVKNKAGIYEDFVIVRTEDSEMDVLAMHKNGALIGYDLWDDNKTVKSLVFKEKEDSEAITMLFDDQGFPKGMVTDHIIVNISSIGENMAELEVLDLQGNKIGKNKIELPVNSQATIKFQEDENSHGPSSSSIFMLNNEDYLSMYIGTSSTLTKAVSCGAGIAVGMAAEAATVGAATPLVIVGVIAACESIYFDLVARYVGENHFLFKELNLASDISSTISSIISVINPLDTNKWVDILTISNDAIPSLKNTVEGGIRLFNKYGTVSETLITGTNQETGKLEIAEEFIRISGLDPALGVASINPKPATIERGRENGKDNYEVFNEETQYHLMDKNIVVTERDLFDKITGELTLGSSELADPDARSKLGKIVLAGFYIINKYTSNKERTSLNLRVVYTETGEIVYANTLNYNDFEPLIENDAVKEATKIIAALEKFANKRVLIIKENPKRYTQ